MEMLDALIPCPPPLRAESDGGIYVGTTEISLDTVLSCYLQGETPADIAEGFPTLDIVDIYATITYYLWHRNQVDFYLEHRRKEAEMLRNAHVAQFPPSEVVLRLRNLKARRA